MKSIVFDLNGIFVKSPYLSDRFEQDFGVPKEAFISALSRIMDVVRLPHAPSVYSLFEPEFDKWGVSLSEQDFLDYWFTAEYLDGEMLAYVKNLRDANVSLFTLSNNFRERTLHYRERFPELAETFDQMYYSWETGLVKPDPAALQAILDEHHLEPTTCLYFDDSKKNVTSFSRIGVQAHVFNGVEQVRQLTKD